MTEGVLIEEYRKIKPLEDRLDVLETKERFFPRPIFQDYRRTILDKITAHAIKIGASIFAIKKEIPTTEDGEWCIEGTYYRLRE